jgi:hypothetical protein
VTQPVQRLGIRGAVSEPVTAAATALLSHIAQQCAADSRARANGAPSAYIAAVTSVFWQCSVCNAGESNPVPRLSLQDKVGAHAGNRGCTAVLTLPFQHIHHLHPDRDVLHRAYLTVVPCL